MKIIVKEKGIKIMEQKQPTKAEMAKKVEAFKTLNSVLVKANADFMAKLRSILEEKRASHETLKNKLEEGKATEDDNAEYLFLGGYIKALEDITGMKKK